jgi:hypothetical protein
MESLHHPKKVGKKDEGRKLQNVIMKKRYFMAEKRRKTNLATQSLSSCLVE